MRKILCCKNQRILVTARIHPTTSTIRDTRRETMMTPTRTKTSPTRPIGKSKRPGAAPEPHQKADHDPQKDSLTRIIREVVVIKVASKRIPTPHPGKIKSWRFSWSQREKSYLKPNTSFREHVKFRYRTYRRVPVTSAIRRPLQTLLASNLLIKMMMFLGELRKVMTKEAKTTQFWTLWMSLLTNWALSLQTNLESFKITAKTKKITLLQSRGTKFPLTWWRQQHLHLRLLTRNDHYSTKASSLTIFPFYIAHIKKRCMVRN